MCWNLIVYVLIFFFFFINVFIFVVVVIIVVFDFVFFVLCPKNVYYSKSSYTLDTSTLLYKYSKSTVLRRTDIFVTLCLGT